MYRIILTEIYYTDSYLADGSSSNVNNISYSGNLITLINTTPSLAPKVGQALRIVDTDTYYAVVDRTDEQVSSGGAYNIKLTVGNEFDSVIKSGQTWEKYDIIKVANSNFCELDTAGIDLETVFAVSDISDIASRKDTITKNISFYGTEKNDTAFGSMFRLDRVVDNYNLPLSKLFFNYTPMRAVDCLVYEDGMLILNGSMIMTEVDFSMSNTVQYQTTITGKFISIKAKLSDSVMSDLDLSDLKHHWGFQQAANSWGPAATYGDLTITGSIEKYNKSSLSFYNESFKIGSGYVYPHADYGNKFEDTSENTDVSKVHVKSLRPAVWMREYIDRIIKGAGYTWELKGSDSFIDRFNRVIIPDSQKELSTDSVGAVQVSQFNGSVTESTSVRLSHFNGGDKAQYSYYHYIPIYNFTSLPESNIYLKRSTVAYTSSDTIPSKFLLQAISYFKSDMKVTAFFSSITSVQPALPYVLIQVGKRTFENGEDDGNGFTVIGQTRVNLTPGGTITNYTASISISAAELDANDQLAIWVYQVGIYGSIPNSTYINTFNLTSLNFTVDGSTGASVGISEGSEIVPVAPDSVQQFDFLKGVINAFNLMVYNSNFEPKKLIFEQYDDFYALSDISNLRASALDWSGKLSRTSTIKIKSNVTIPKTYTFSMKSETSDSVNADYNNRYSEIYGQVYFEDALGIADEKKVQLPFSPSPAFQWGGTGRVMAALFGNSLDFSERETVKNSMRMIFYNGIKTCNDYGYYDDSFSSSGVWSISSKSPNLEVYCEASEILYNDDLSPAYLLNFGIPRLWYVQADSSYNKVSGLYESHYINQTTELTDVNLFTIQAEMLLNEVDIQNISFKVPIFISAKRYGHAYFKLIEVQYAGNNKTSTVTLQKIVYPQ